MEGYTLERHIRIELGNTDKIELQKNSTPYEINYVKHPTNTQTNRMIHTRMTIFSTILPAADLIARRQLCYAHCVCICVYLVVYSASIPAMRGERCDGTALIMHSLISHRQL